MVVEDETTSLTTPSVNQSTSSKLPKYPFFSTIYVLFCSFAFALSSFQFGLGIGQMTTVQTALSQCDPVIWYNNFFSNCVPMDSVHWSVATSIFTIGGLLGGLTGGIFANIMGRKPFLWFSNFLFIGGSLIMSLQSNFYILCVGRFLNGLGSGIATTVVPMYIGEVAPVALRGLLGTLPQLCITVGILAVQFLGIFPDFGVANYQPLGWRLIFGLQTVIPILQLILVPLASESPRWLLSKGREQDAIRCLKWLRWTSDVSIEYDTMRQEMQPKDQISEEEEHASSSSKPTTSILGRFFRRELLIPYLIGVSMHLAQQYSGINAVMYYTNEMFKQAGLQYPSIGTVMVAILNVSSTIFVSFIMDKAGRKVLLIIGQIGMLFFTVVLCICLIISEYAQISEGSAGKTVLGVLSVICILGYVATFAISLGPIPWILPSELFPDDVKAYATSFCVGVNWLSTFIVTFMFPILQQSIGPFCFLPFTVCIFISLLFSIFVVRETKGKTINEVLHPSKFKKQYTSIDDNMLHKDSVY